MCMYKKECLKVTSFGIQIYTFVTIKSFQTWHLWNGLHFFVYRSKALLVWGAAPCLGSPHHSIKRVTKISQGFKALPPTVQKNNITIGEISGVHWGLKERWFWLTFRVLNHILEVLKSGKAPKTKIGSDLAIFGQNLDKKIVLPNPHGFLWMCVG